MPGVIVAVFALLLSAASAQAQVLDRVEVYEYGTYLALDGEELEPTGKGIKRAVAYNLTHTETTREIHAGLGTRFGFRLLAIGAPAGAEVPLTVVWKFPAPGVVGSVSGNNIEQDEYDSETFIGQGDAILWSFEEISELVPGTWTVEIWFEGRKLAEQNFEIILAPIS